MTGRATVAEPASAESGQLATAARNGAISLVGSGIAALAGLGLNVVIGRGLGAGASGVFFVAVAVLTVAATVSRMGADTGLVWALSRARALGRPLDVRRIVTVGLVPSLAAGTVLAVAVGAAAPWIGATVSHQGGRDTEALLRLGAGFLVLAGPCLVLAAALRGIGDIIGFAGVQNVAVPALRPLFAWIAVAAGFGVSGAMLAWSAPLVLGTAAAAALVVRRTRRMERRAGPDAAPPRRWSTVAREFWRFSLPRSATAVVEVAIVWSDVVLVAALASPREAGIYAAASRFVTSGTLAEAAMRVAMAPQINRLLTLGDRAGASVVCGVATQWIVLLAWPLYLVLALYSPFVLSLFGPEFRDGAAALTLLSFAMMVVMAAGNNQTVLLMSGRSGLQLINKSVVFALGLLLNLVLVPRWGMNGAAVAWAVSVVLDAGIAMTQVRFVVGVRIPLQRVWPAMAMSALAFVPPGLVGRAWGDQGPLQWTAALAVSAVLFLALAWRFRDRLEIEPLRQAISARRG